MRRIAVGVLSAVLSLAAVTPASAQGRAVEWTGLYVGANAGYTFRTVDFSAQEIGPFFYNSAFDTITGPVSGGFTFGGQVGYNFQVADVLVVGGEFSYGQFGYSGSGESIFFNGDTMAETKGGRGWTALGRAGYLVNNQALAYFAFGRLSARNDVSILDDCDTPPCGFGLIDIMTNGTRGANVWGVGFEYMVKPEAARPLSVKVEWLNSDFRTFVTAEDASGDYRWSFNTHFPKSMLRASVNIHLGR